jgi:hypothetical protein
MHRPVEFFATAVTSLNFKLPVFSIIYSIFDSLKQPIKPSRQLKSPAATSAPLYKHILNINSAVGCLLINGGPYMFHPGFSNTGLSLVTALQPGPRVINHSTPIIVRIFPRIILYPVKTLKWH